MAKRKSPFKDQPQPIRPDLKARFNELIAAGKERTALPTSVGGFKIKNTNQLWRWDNLEDVLP